MEAGLNLYSLRDMVQTKNGFAETLRKIKAMGYSYVQISGMQLSPQEIAAEVKAAGLPVYLTHSSLDALVNEPQKVMDDNAVFGCKNIGLGYMPWEIIADESKSAEVIQKLERVGQLMNKNGFTFFLHHHNNEFFKLNGKTFMDKVVELAPSVHFVIDTYWLQYGGAEPSKYINKLAGRCECIHLKDYRTVCKDGGMHPRFAPVGAGTLDFNEIVKAAKQAGAKYFFVEQDDACEYDAPLEQVKQSINYITENL